MEMCIQAGASKGHNKSTASIRFNYKRGRYKEMNDELSKINWNVLENMNVQAAWDFVKEKLHAAIQVHAPRAKKKKRRGMTPPWWDKELKREVKKKTQTMARLCWNKRSRRIQKLYTTEKHNLTEDKKVKGGI